MDDHYGAGIVDASAALKKARDGRGAGELGLAGAVALLGIDADAPARDRGRAPGARLRGRVAGRFVGAVLPARRCCRSRGRTCTPSAAALSGGFADTLTGALGSRQPAACTARSRRWRLTVLLYGVRKLRPALAGFGFGVAGALLFAAVSGTVDVRLRARLPRPDLAGRPRGRRRPVRHRGHPQGVTPASAAAERVGVSGKPLREAPFARGGTG